jgi:hypothetical protein
MRKSECTDEQTAYAARQAEADPQVDMAIRSLLIRLGLEPARRMRSSSPSNI